MEVGIRKGAWRRAWRYPAYLWSLRWVYAVKKPRRLVYGVYPRIPPPIHHCTIPFTNKAGVIRNLEPQNCTPNFSPVAYPILLIFSEFEDPLKVYQCQPKFPLNLLPVLYTNIGKFVLKIPETHLPSEFRVKNRCIQFLGQKCKIGAVLAWSDIWTQLKSMETLNLISARDSPRGSTEIGYAHAYGSLECVCNISAL